MTGRPLFSQERRAVQIALANSHIADQSLYQRAIDGSRFIPFDHPLPPLHRGLRPAIAYFALRQRASGITLGTQIYIRRQIFDPRGGLPLYLVIHEVAHVVQFMRDGTLPFLVRYLGEYAAGRLRGMSDREAYLAISYERQARMVEGRHSDRPSS